MFDYKISAIDFNGPPTIILSHSDGTFTEITFAKTGIGIWYKDAEYAEIDFPELEKIYQGEEE